MLGSFSRARHSLTIDAAAEGLRGEARLGKFHSEVVEAVLAAGGHRVHPKRSERPAGLSEREVEVLGLAIRGLSNRQMAEMSCTVESPDLARRSARCRFAVLGRMPTSAAASETEPRAATKAARTSI